MQTPYVTYQEAMGELSMIIRSAEPGYVRIRAICAVVNELSPSNSAQRENHLALGLEPHPEQPQHPQPQFDPVTIQNYTEAAEIMRELWEEAGLTSGDEEDDEEEEEPQ